MSQIWNTLIEQPIAWLLLTLYDLTANYGLALILFTLVIKVLFLPFSMKGKKGMMDMQRLSPKLKELEARHKNDKEKYNLEVQKLYQKEKVNPLSGCLWQLLPWPIFIALYNVIRNPLTNLMGLDIDQVQTIIQNSKITEYLTQNGIDLAVAAKNNQIAIANAVHQYFGELQTSLPDMASSLVDIDYSFLGLNLSLTPVFNIINAYWFLPLISGAIMWLSTAINQKMSGTANQEQNQQMKMMTVMGPGMSVYIGYMWPSAMAIYWIANSAFGVLQDYLLTVYYQKVYAEKDRARSIEEEAERQKLAQKKAEQAARREANPQKSNTAQKKYKKVKQIQSSKENKPSNPGGSEGETQG